MAKSALASEKRIKLPFILLVEDDDNDALGIELAFAKLELSAQVRRVVDGAHAMDYLEGKADGSNSPAPRPSIVLMDLHMPRKDGFEVLSWIRAHPTFRHLVVVVLTSSENEADIRKALDFGANSYLIKPDSFLEFTNMLQQLAAFWKMHQQPSSPATSIQPATNA